MLYLFSWLRWQSYFSFITFFSEMWHPVVFVSISLYIVGCQILVSKFYFFAIFTTKLLSLKWTFLPTLSPCLLSIAIGYRILKMNYFRATSMIILFCFINNLRFGPSKSTFILFWHIFAILWSLPYFLVQQEMPAHLIFYVLQLGSISFPKGYLEQGKALRNKILVLDVLIRNHCFQDCWFVCLFCVWDRISLWSLGWT